MAASSAGCPGTPALARSCCLPCLLPNMYLRSVLTNTGDETGGEEGTEGEERQGKGSRASCRHGLQQTGAPSPARTGLSGHGAGSNRAGKPTSPVATGPEERPPDTVRGTPAKRETGRGKPGRAPAPWLAEPQAPVPPQSVIHQAEPGSSAERGGACHHQQLRSALPPEHNMVTPV